MSTKRDIIDSLRVKLREKGADSTFSNKFLYQTILEQASWLIKREANAGKIWTSDSLFQNLPIKIVEVSLIDSCLPVKTNCKIYRSENRLPSIWEETDGQIIRSVSSIDNSTDFFFTTSTAWSKKKKDPYRNKGVQNYFFFDDGYIWIPDKNPHYVIVQAFFIDEISLVMDDCIDCNEKECIKFLDTPSRIPVWIEAELLSKAVELLAGVSKKEPEDEKIDKNTNDKS